MSFSPKPEDNVLLAMLPESIRERLYSKLSLISIPFKANLLGPKQSHLYFPAGCVISLLKSTKNGELAEIALIGSEGMIDISSFWDNGNTTFSTRVQHPGPAFMIHYNTFAEEFNSNIEMRSIVLHYTTSLVYQIAQIAVCNRHCKLDQQLCRWLLSMLDRLPSNTFKVTQETIANMLGVRREGVTLAATKLQMAGLIEYSRGSVTVLNREKLKQRACECYKSIT